MARPGSEPGSGSTGLADPLQHSAKKADRSVADFGRGIDVSPATPYAGCRKVALAADLETMRDVRVRTCHWCQPPLSSTPGRVPASPSPYPDDPGGPVPARYCGAEPNISIVWRADAHEDRPAAVAQQH